MTELEKMQAEAVNHARAMYRRRTPSYTPPPQTEAPPDAAQDTPPQTRPEEQPRERERKSDILAPLFEDKERTLILLLLILLSEEGAESGAVMALLYCLL